MVSYRLLVAACLASFAFGAGLVWRLQTVTERVDYRAVLSEAKQALSTRQYDLAEKLARQIPQHDRRHIEGLLIQGEAASKLEQLDRALALYEQVPRDGSEADGKARMASGDILLNLGRMQAALEAFEHVLKHFPDEPFSLGRVALIVDLSGQRFEASELMFDLLQRDAFSAKHLLFLADSTAVHEPAKEVKRDRPDEVDPLVNLANGRYLLWKDEFDEARGFLARALQQSPRQLEASIRLGEILLLRSAEAEFAAWHAALPSDAERHPMLWVLRGQWSERQGDHAAAARCYWEALRRDPNVRTACYRLGQLLPLVAAEFPPEPFVRRAVALQELTTVADLIYTNENHIEGMKSAAELTESLGRNWEAVGWARAALAVNRDLVWAQQLRQRWKGKLLPELPRNDPMRDPAQAIDLSHLPVPTIVAPPTAVAVQESSSERPSVSFSEDAEAIGVRFTYFQGPDPTTESGRMFEFTGGGIAVVDFDQDGQPDMYFAQGCEWPPVAGQIKHLDRLFWNRGDGFLDVTEAARLQEDRFSQGATVGDFDQDGFPDLYVANTHQNRLWRNMGDGTFQDVTEVAELTASRWTTSCLIADLNGDTLPEIVDVNYAQGNDLFTRICQSEGIFRSCSPTVFKADNDQVFLNLGDGRTRDVSSEAGWDLGEGRGLGIVAFCPEQQPGRLNLFVANDMTANFYFVNRTSEPGRPPRFDEFGVFSGLAFDVNGAAQASMGVACADADGNGLLDFFVTNFYAEANNLYLQQPGGTFSDEASAQGLRDASYEMLGFGAQFLDADWDGWPDLVVANGHVDDFSYKGIPYRMRSQFFQNQGRGKFVELTGDGLGAFFQRPVLGRGLAKLDWNGDRKEDFAVTFLEDPAVVLTNRTHHSRHAVTVQLRGRTVDREAIGTIVKLTAGGRERVAQLVAGDGYFASNERRLVFGLGEAERVDRLEVLWTDGSSDRHTDLPVDADYLLVQGRSILKLERP